MLAAGILLFVVDLIRNLRPTSSDSAGNVWDAGTLEWLPNDVYGLRSIPHVQSRDPLWDQPGLAKDVEAGRYYLPGAATGRRETIITSAIEATPQYVARVPGPGWTPILSAVLTAAFFMLLTVKLIAIAVACGLLAVALMLVWMWRSDPPPLEPVDIGSGLTLPTYVSGPMSHSWWAMVVLMLVAGALYFAFVFSYLYLWTVAPQTWPGSDSLPSLSFPLVTGILLIGSSAVVYGAGRALEGRASSQRLFVPLILLAVAAIFFGSALEILAQWQTGLRPDASGYGAMVYVASCLQAELIAALVIMTAFVSARRIAGALDRVRRVSFDNLVLLWHYTVAQGVLGLILIHGFPRVTG